MDQDEIVVTDRNMRIRDEKTEQMMRDIETQKLNNAARAEEKRMNKPGLFDGLMNGVEKIKKLIYGKSVKNQSDHAKQR